MPDNPETNEPTVLFNFSAYPADTLFHERREGRDRREIGTGAARPQPTDRRSRPERRRRIDPTTFEKQYTEDELEFMNAMQTFKVRTGKAFPSYGDVLRVARQLGYTRAGSGLAGDSLCANGAEPALALGRKS